MIDSRKIKKNWIYLLFANPKVYLYTLIKNTITVGAISYILNVIYLRSNYADIKIPVTFYSLIGLAIGLLLVFRTQSAYERWFSASKNFNEIYNSLAFYVMKTNSILRKVPNAEDKGKLYNSMITTIDVFAIQFHDYLACTDDVRSKHLEYQYLNELNNLLRLPHKIGNKIVDCENSDIILLQKTISDVINSAGSCVRIKNTPIPMSYSMHIKVGVIFYILTLPFGMFYDLKLYSTLMVMLTYYIVAGIEIISTEIENPFQGTPNDLPMDKYFTELMEMPKKLIL